MGESESVMAASLYDTLKQAAVDHVSAVYDVDRATAQWTVVMRHSAANDTDVSLILNRRQTHVDSAVHRHQRPVTLVTSHIACNIALAGVDCQLL